MDFSTILIFLASILLLGVLIALFFLSRHLAAIRSHQLSNQDSKLFELLNQNMQGLQTQLHSNLQGMTERLDKTTSDMNTRLDNAARVIGNLNKELGSMSEIGRSLKDFQHFITSPKLRGNLGEQILYDALDQVFSTQQYARQFKFKDGQIVDAIIKTSDTFIPIDSKFPMESFKYMHETSEEAARERLGKEFARAVKKHVDDVAKKYILPQEGTVDFAVMYVPSENVYYEIVTNHGDVLEHARMRNVLLVSPNSFFHFLRVILMGLERTKIQEEAKKIWELLKALQQENEKMGESFQLVGRHLGNAKNAMEDALTRYDKFTGKMDQVKLLG